MLNKDKMREYQRNRRKQQKVASQDAPQSTNGCKPDVNHPVNQVCKPVKCKPKDVNLVNPADDVVLIDGTHLTGQQFIDLVGSSNIASFKHSSQLKAGEYNKVSLPGDADYVSDVDILDGQHIDWSKPNP